MLFGVDKRTILQSSLLFEKMTKLFTYFLQLNGH